MTALMTQPGLYDIEGWRKLVEDLRAAPAEEVNQTLLFCAEVHLRAIEAKASDEIPQNMPAETA